MSLLRREGASRVHSSHPESLSPDWCSSNNIKYTYEIKATFLSCTLWEKERRKSTGLSNVCTWWWWWNVGWEKSQNNEKNNKINSSNHIKITVLPDVDKVQVTEVAFPFLFLSKVNISLNKRLFFRSFQDFGSSAKLANWNNPRLLTSLFFFKCSV